MNAYLLQTIGIHDYSIKKELKENYYHGFMVGLLKHSDEWDVFSNMESGEGFSDIMIEIPEQEMGIIIEIKNPDHDALEQGCLDALRQIEDKKYEARLLEDGMTKIIKYGIAFYKKRCKVKNINEIIS